MRSTIHPKHDSTKTIQGVAQKDSTKTIQAIQNSSDTNICSYKIESHTPTGAAAGIDLFSLFILIVVVFAIILVIFSFL